MLSESAKMNVKADKLATKERKLRYAKKTYKVIPTTTSAKIQIKIKNRISTRLRSQEMYTQITEDLGDEY